VAEGRAWGITGSETSPGLWADVLEIGARSVEQGLIAGLGSGF
jgi:hypothetical protein